MELMDHLAEGHETASDGRYADDVCVTATGRDPSGRRYQLTLNAVTGLWHGVLPALGRDGVRYAIPVALPPALAEAWIVAHQDALAADRSRTKAAAPRRPSSPLQIATGLAPAADGSRGDRQVTLFQRPDGAWVGEVVAGNAARDERLGYVLPDPIARRWIAAWQHKQR